MAENDDIPDEFSDTYFSEAFPADEFLSWLENEASTDIREDVQEFLDEGFSLEWSTAFIDRGIEPGEIDSISFINTDGEWSVVINDEVFHFPDADLASDYIWADLYFHAEDYDIEISSGETA